MSARILCRLLLIFLVSLKTEMTQANSASGHVTEKLEAQVISTATRICEELGLRVKNVKPEAGAVGGGFVSTIKRVHITCHGTADQLHTIHVLVKSASPDLTVRKHVPVTGMMTREIMFYKEISPLMDRLVEHDVSTGVRTPRCYFASGEYLKEFIIMENLSVKGFKLADQKKPVGYEHASLAMKSLAKFHGQALLMQAKEPHKFFNITLQLTDNFMTSAGDYDANGMRRYSDLAFDKFVGAVVDQDAKTKLKVLGDKFSDKFINMSGAGNIKVITHADYWINNIMFKYENGTPIEAAMLDFQMLRHSSIANDILSYIGTCFEVELRRSHYHQLLNDYYQQLNLTVAAGGLNLQQICTWDQLQKEIKEQAFFGLAMASIQIQFFDENPIEDLKILYSGNLPSEFFQVSATYRKLANDLVEDFISWKLL